MELDLPLLGTINDETGPNQPVRKKWIVKVTAEQLATWFQYERESSKKSASFKTLGTSLIKIDPKIQRGDDSNGYHGQNAAKIGEIKSILLQEKNATVPRIYLGTLVWNIRPPAVLSVAKQEIENKPPKWRLVIDTTEIHLTDSAHRHFGICEAVRAYKSDKEANLTFPLFRPNFEFSVEIYNLDFQGEKELFSELNGKQKKISAAKQKELDVSSPIGALKDAILACDMQENRILENNIEVSSNQNTQHTLLTMSVFVASIAEMFSSDEIKLARDDSDARDEMAEYYCAFLLSLTTLRVRADLDKDGKDEDYAPFRNLYQKVIKPVESQFDAENPVGSDERLEAARAAARTTNLALRHVDLANNNGTIKALFRIGRLIRRFPSWNSVIDRLQNDLLVGSNGKFFQAENEDLLSAHAGDVPIALKTNDGGLNLQVQTKNINKLYDYLCRKLDLVRRPEFRIQVDGQWHQLGDTQHKISLLDDAKRILTFRVFYDAIKAVDVDEPPMLSIDSNWKQLIPKAAKKLAPTKLDWDQSYEDPSYPDIGRRMASFNLELPSGSELVEATADVKITLNYPDFGGEVEKVKFLLLASK
ncbi:MAG: hypothetical protein JWP01_2517 [Myxococcales bacterium]|nr:hypothetical protein [Myxococcales bacterium]